MAHWQIPTSHIFTRWDFVTAIKVGNAVMMMMIIVMRTMTMMNVMMLILVLTWSIQQAAEARSEYTAGKPA